MSTKINVQKSYWRLKEHLYSSGEVKNTATIVKLQKVFYIIGKYYNYNLLKGFYSIFNLSRNRYDQMDVSKVFRDRYGRESELQETPRDTLELAEYSRVAVSEVDFPTGSNQLTGVKMLERAFAKNMQKHVRAWQDNALPEQRMDRLNKEVKEYNPQFVGQVSKLGAVEFISRLATLLRLKNISYGFKAITHSSILSKTDQQYE